MVTASEAAEEYRTVLMELKRNDKTQINLLTILAEDYASFSSEIVKVIEESVYKFPAALKIVVLYVVDSILKNIQVTGGYRDLFAKKIVDLIVHVFKESDEKTRASIHRLRCTWVDIFPKSRLYMIDTKINSIDRAWPVLNPNVRPPTVTAAAASLPIKSGAGHVVHVNPRFFNNGKASSAASRSEPGAATQRAAPPSSAAVIKEEPEKEGHSAVSSTTPEPSTSSLVVTIGNNTKDKSGEKPIKKEQMEEDEPEPVKDPRKKAKPMEVRKEAKPTREVKKEAKPMVDKSGKEVEGPKLLKERRKSREIKEPKEVGAERRAKRTSDPVLKKQRLDFPNRIPKKTASQTGPKKEMSKPASLLSMRLAPPNFVTQMHPSTQKPKQLQPPPAAAAPPPLKRLRPNHGPPQQQQQQQHGFPLISKVGPIEPTAALGAHAFGHKVVSALQSSATLPPPGDAASSPHSEPVMMDSFTPPHQNAPPLLEQPSTTAGECPMPMQQPPLVQSQPPPHFIESQPSFPAPAYNIQNVTPRLPGVPENNRIFVDGKAYEVFYLEQAAVIERNGLPHRVTFAGPARDVIIDGVAHRLAFGEQKQVLIDGGVHFLRFGAPSRELYMGDFPFKGAFGGPPIIATIDGRRHEIRLCGPPPEVRIDPEPSYELMRYMPAIRHQQPQAPKVEPKKEPSLDVSSLLNRLRNSGILSQMNEADRKNREREAAIAAKSSAIGRSNSPPVPCNHRLDHIERRPVPMAGFDQFSMRSLIIRYDSVIDSIHRQRKSCQHCGIGFEELYGEAYQRHVDWHLQDTLRMKDPRYKYTRSQPWYMLEDWFTYSETEIVNRATQNTETDKQQSSAEEQIPPMGQQQTLATGDGGSQQDALSNSIPLKECQVCKEHFEEYWDEEEDVWRLRDCVISDGKAFHSYCREDVVSANNAKSAQQMETEGDQQQQSDIGDRLDNSDSDLRMSAGDTNPSLAMELDVDPASKFEGGGRLEDDEEMKDGSQLDDDKNTDNQIYIENKGGGGAAATGGE